MTTFRDVWTANVVESARALIKEIGDYQHETPLEIQERIDDLEESLKDLEEWK